nr:retrovirus-related Pol polyprotein [Tanacetum cinerariifolium]
MQTRSSSRLVSNPSSNPTPSTNPNPKGRNRRRSKQRIEEFNLDELSPPIVTMADQRTMAQLLQSPIEDYEDAIVVPAITADNFELKHGLLTLVQNKQFFEHDKEDPHAHGASRIWLEKEPPRSIFTWDDLVSKFINQFFPPSKTTNLRNKITNFQQRFDESFSKAWDRFKDLLRACPYHGFSKLHQLDTFYNALNFKDQDSLNSAAGAYQAPAYQVPAPQTQGVSKEDFLAYIKANNAVMRNMQTQGQNMQNQLTNLTDLITKFVNSNSASTSSSELADCLISRPVGVAEDFYVKVGDHSLRMEDLLLTCSKEVLGFSNVIASRNSTPYYDLIVSTTSSNLTPFKNNDFLLEKVDAFFKDDPTLTEVDQSYFDSEGDILLLEAYLTNDPSPPPQGNYLPQARKELKICEAKSEKSSIDEPLEVELKDLPPHLEYAFLECDDKLPIIIAKDMSMEEKTALITVLKPHRRAIAWKLSDIKGIDPEVCTYKILMEEDFEPAIQHQKRVNPKIHDVIKQEEINTIVFLTVFLVISKFPSFRKIRRKPHSPAHTERLVNAAYLLGYAMLQARFRELLSYLERMLKRCKDTNLCLNWEKSYFMVKKGIVLGHKISKQGIEVDKAKVDVITKLPYPTTVKGIRSFLGHAGFYRHFIKDFS